MARTAEEMKASVIKQMFDQNRGEIEGVVAIVKHKPLNGGPTLVVTTFTAELTVGQGLDLLKAGWRTLRNSHFGFAAPTPGTIGPMNAVPKAKEVRDRALTKLMNVVFTYVAPDKAWEKIEADATTEKGDGG